MNWRHFSSLAIAALCCTALVVRPGNGTTPIENENTEMARVGSPGVQPPKFLSRVKPEYPTQANGMQGYVILEVVCLANGTMGDIKILRGLGSGKFGFEDAAIEAVKQWTFEPGSMNGETCDVLMTLKMDFVDAGQRFPITVLEVEGDFEPGLIVAPKANFAFPKNNSSYKMVPVTFWVNPHDEAEDVVFPDTKYLSSEGLASLRETIQFTSYVAAEFEGQKIKVKVRAWVPCDSDIEKRPEILESQQLLANLTVPKIDIKEASRKTLISFIADQLDVETLFLPGFEDRPMTLSAESVSSHLLLELAAPHPFAWAYVDGKLIFGHQQEVAQMLQ